MEINRANLEKHYHFLMDHVVDKLDFDMRRLGNGNYYSQDPHAICGTCACSLGYAVLWADKSIIKRCYGGNCFEFLLLCSYLFGIPNPLGSETTYFEKSLWGWLFSSSWSDVDNTALGAAKRIRYFLDNGLPNDWYDQMTGAEPIIYM